MSVGATSLPALRSLPVTSGRPPESNWAPGVRTDDARSTVAMPKDSPMNGRFDRGEAGLPQQLIARPIVFCGCKVSHGDYACPKLRRSRLDPTQTSH
ncbi:hypothetical protein FA95DRAFT_924400 [Auriscalpium vulgare]|uniref:Uncharacterized protein n=1 Tax=Auriscalpium vulgare TaxID=40419 RepID=A0ACB8RZA6_9AGAM|nr:hypothetical protein FA95DRAFT_924400 [Auriscalpium vulgare]